MRLLLLTGLLAALTAPSVRPAAAWEAGLAADGPRWARARLAYDLGLVRLAADPATADSLFALATTEADDPDLRARAAYHAGLAALGAGQPDRAMSHLRRSLLLVPDARDAQRAYEIARRRVATPPEPTPEAEALMAEARRLVATRRYTDALDLLQRNRARVPSLAAFDEWTGRLAGVVEIERSTPVAPDSVPSP